MESGTDVTYLIAIGISIFLIGFFYYVPIMLWFKAKASGINISLGQLFFMKLRKAPTTVIVETMITAHKADLYDVTLEKLEAHYHAGGNVKNVVIALIIAKQERNISATFEKVSAMDLAGYLEDFEKLIAEKASCTDLPEYFKDLKSLKKTNH